jgi:hypothetical protein
VQCAPYARRWALGQPWVNVRETLARRHGTALRLVRLTESGKISKGRRKRGLLHRFARKNTRELHTVDLGQVTDLEKHQHLAELSISAAITMASHETAARQIEAQATPMPLLIDPAHDRDPFKGL